MAAKESVVWSTPPGPNQKELLIGMLLSFAKADLDTYTSKEIRSVGEVLQVMAWTSGNPEIHALSLVKHTRKGRLATHPFPRLNRAELKDLQHQLRDALDALVPKAGDPGYVWTVPGPITSVEVSPKTFARVYAAPWPTSLWLALADVLGLFRDRIRRCPECQTVFLKWRRALHCSPQCSRRGRNRRWYEKHADELSEIRHQRYKDRVKKDLPKVRVQRRRRIKKEG